MAPELTTNHLTTILLGLVLFAITLPSQAMRCGTRLVATGDTKLDVQHKCGEPSFIEGSGIVETETQTRAAARLNQQLLLIGRQQHRRAEPVETWHYNCGANQFSRVLTFVGPFLKRIDTAKRGFGNSGCKQSTSAGEIVKKPASTAPDNAQHQNQNHPNRRLLDAAIEFRQLHERNLNAATNSSSSGVAIQRYQDDQGQWHYSAKPPTTPNAVTVNEN